jgi:hypothetical protein
MAAAPTRRVASGRGHIYYLDGTKMVGRGATTLIGNGVPKNALQYWAARLVAQTAVEDRDTWIPMVESGRERAAVEYLKESPFAERDAAARRGTEVHSLAEKLHAGEEIDVPEELEGHVDSYIAFLEEWGVEPVVVEKMVVNRRHRYCGTFDSILTIDRWRINGRPATVLADIKTTRSGVFPENALQLASYRYAETYLPLEGGDEEPMPQVDACAVIWVRADDYDLVPIDAGPAAFRFFLYAAQVADFCGDAGKAMVLPARTPDPESEAA